MKTFDELFDKADHMIKTFVQQGGQMKKRRSFTPWEDTGCWSNIS